LRGGVTAEAEAVAEAVAEAKAMELARLNVEAERVMRDYKAEAAAAGAAMHKVEAVAGAAEGEEAARPGAETEAAAAAAATAAVTATMTDAVAAAAATAATVANAATADAAAAADLSDCLSSEPGSGARLLPTALIPLSACGAGGERTYPAWSFPEPILLAGDSGHFRAVKEAFGEAVKVEPMNSKLKEPGTERLKL
jgi:hypothetical protein